MNNMPKHMQNCQKLSLVSSAHLDYNTTLPWPSICVCVNFLTKQLYIKVFWIDCINILLTEVLPSNHHTQQIFCLINFSDVDSMHFVTSLYTFIQAHMHL